MSVTVTGTQVTVTVSDVGTNVLTDTSTHTVINKTIDGNLNTIIDVESSHNIRHHVRKNSAGTIPKGTPIYVTGYHATQEFAYVEAADASDPSKLPAIGIAAEDIGNDTNYHGTHNGIIIGLDTSAWGEGDLLYIASGGGLTNARPIGAADGIQTIAVVARSHANNGIMYVNGPGRTNAAPNLVTGKHWQGDADNQPAMVDANLLIPYTVATLPSGSNGQMIFVTDEVGGAVPAFYDGANWRRVTDRAIVS